MDPGGGGKCHVFEEKEVSAGDHLGLPLVVRSNTFALASLKCIGPSFLSYVNSNNFTQK